LIFLTIQVLGKFLDIDIMFTGYNTKKRVNERYKIVGFISSGTYGRVYKAEGKNGRIGEFAIKK
jgi:cyclin-dependent kinase 8/11